MAQKTEPLAATDELASLWNNLLRMDRRALLELAHGELGLERLAWAELSIDVRMRLVRAMRALTELAVDCAVALERAKIALELNARTPRDELQDKIDEAAFAGAGDAAAARQEAQAIRRELAELRKRRS